MAKSLTTDGLSLDYRDVEQTEVSGTYPIGSVIALSEDLTLPGTWIYRKGSFFGSASFGVGSAISYRSFAIRVE